MPTVSELTGLQANFLLAPRAGAGVCVNCFNLTDGYQRCYACSHGEAWLDAIAPISYSPANEQLHHLLVTYKRSSGEAARRCAIQLAAILWRYLTRHERCVAATAGAEAFPLVTTVPSGERNRDDGHPLRRIVGQLVGPTRGRHERLLRRSAHEAVSHAFDGSRFEAVRPLAREPILLIDDTWTTGANAQSAAAALKAAGAELVAAVVIGRHVNRGWGENDRRLQTLERPFDWDRCALCSPRVVRGTPGASPAPIERNTPSAAGRPRPSAQPPAAA